MASIRRSLFSNDERQQFLASLVRGICLILKNGSNLSNLEVYHEFCRLLGRLKARVNTVGLSNFFVSVFYPKLNLTYRGVGLIRTMEISKKSYELAPP